MNETNKRSGSIRSLLPEKKENQPYKKMNCGHYQKDQFRYMDGCAKCTKDFYERKLKEIKR